MDFMKMLQPDFKFSDSRGALIQLVHKGYEQVNVLKTKAGVVRGGHYHKETSEAFFVVDGRLEILLKKDGAEQTVTFEAGDFFCIQPFVWHTMRFKADTILVALYEKAVERVNGTKDIYSE